MYQGIAKMHSPNWFAEDKEKLEKVLLELWPNSKINPRKMYYYIDNVKAFYPEVVQDALSKIVSTQEHDRRPTINQLVKVCRDIVRVRHRDSNEPEQSSDCVWCTGQGLVFVGLYLETPERCKALDIVGKNVLMLNEREWAVRPDWGHELEMDLHEYMAHCPHCSHPALLSGNRSALNWQKRFRYFTEFRCKRSGLSERQWRSAFTIYRRMISPVRPTGPLTFDEINKEETLFHQYLAKLPSLGEFEERKMNVVEEEPRGEYPEWRKEEADKPGPEAEEGQVLPSKDEGLVSRSGLRGGDSREDPEDSDQGLEG